ncbi:hypothetical protein HG531_005341 [Fusarium graminearum]|nr:hypothetical protein HG531_005341 [Fusarium graminearum]
MIPFMHTKPRTTGSNVQCNSNTSSNTHENGDDDVCGNVLENLNHGLLRLLVHEWTMLKVVGRLVLSLARTVVWLVAVFVAMMRLLSVAALKLILDALPCVVDHVLGSTPHVAILWGLLTSSLNFDISDENLSAQRLDKLDCNRRNAVDESIANFNNSHFDVDNFHMLILVDSFRANG